MDGKKILPIVLVAVMLVIFTTVSADDVKHKRVIVKVPKKINHIHHHHVKKVHVYKHKPKEIHSIHVVEEEEPITSEWKNPFKKQNKFSRHRGFFGNEWKYGAEDGKDYGFGVESEEEDEGYLKSESHDEPIVWKGKKKNGKRSHHRGASNRGKSSSRPNWKDVRPKRQKNLGPYYRQESYYRPEQSEYRIHSLKKPKTPIRSTKSKKQSKKRKPKPPTDKEYSDYGEYYDDGHFSGTPLWPERKEHISWHAKENSWHQLPVVPLATETPRYMVENYRTEHKGEINLSKPEIQEVQAPQFSPNQAIQELHLWAKQIGKEQNQWAKDVLPNTSTQSWSPDVVQKPQLWPHDSAQQQLPWTKPVVQEPELWQKPVIQELKPWSNPVVQEPPLWENHATQAPKKSIPNIRLTERPRTSKPIVQDHKDNLNKRLEGYHIEVEHSGTGYSSHIGHSADGDSSSFQSVRFGDKIKHR